MAKPNIKVDARLFTAVSLVRSTEEVRFYLNGVYVQPHPEQGALLIATDGHRMVVAHDADGHCDTPAIISLPKNAVSLKAKKTADHTLIEVDTDGIATTEGFRSQTSVLIDGTYPDWSAAVRPVLTNAKKRFYGKVPLEPASVNGTYLADFGKMAKFLSGQDYGALRFVTFNEADAALVLFPHNPNVFGILMPMRTISMEVALPGFMKEVLEPSRKRISRKAA